MTLYNLSRVEYTCTLWMKGYKKNMIRLIALCCFLQVCFDSSCQICVLVCFFPIISEFTQCHMLWLILWVNKYYDYGNIQGHSICSIIHYLFTLCHKLTCSHKISVNGTNGSKLVNVRKYYDKNK